jgi:hypothetical protein
MFPKNKMPFFENLAIPVRKVIKLQAQASRQPVRFAIFEIDITGLPAAGAATGAMEIFHKKKMGLVPRD